MLPSAAAGAGAVQDDVVAGDEVAGRGFEVDEGALERGVFEGLDAAAGVADQVVMVVPVGVDRLVAGDAGAEVDALDEPFGGEQFEDAIDARDADLAV